MIKQILIGISILTCNFCLAKMSQFVRAEKILPRTGVNVCEQCKCHKSTENRSRRQQQTITKMATRQLARASSFTIDGSVFRTHTLAHIIYTRDTCAFTRTNTSVHLSSVLCGISLLHQSLSNVDFFASWSLGRRAQFALRFSTCRTYLR